MEIIHPHNAFRGCEGLLVTFSQYFNKYKQVKHKQQCLNQINHQINLYTQHFAGSLSQYNPGILFCLTIIGRSGK